MSRAAAALLALLVPPLLPAARGDCVPAPRLSFAELVTSLDSYRIGTEVTYRCRPGFIRADGKSPVITCQENSTWSQHSEFCVAIPCLPPPEVANGAHSGEGEGYVFGSSVTYTCKSGFRLIGEASIHCTTEDNLNGVWSPAPQCKVQCGLLPTTTGAKPSHSSLSKSFPIGTRVTYKCLEGFLQIPDKSNTVECLSSLEWSKLPELCGRSCPAPRGLLFAKVSEEDERRSFYPVGTTVSYVCRNGYERVPGQDSTRTCLEDLTWSKPPEFCTKKSCGVPEAPAHGRIPDTTRTLFGDTARIVCDEGYRLSGSHIACRLKGREVAWSQLPTCVEVMCSIPAVPNRKKKFGSVAVYSYGDTTIFECNPGYTLRGGGDGVIRCAEDNTWKPSVPICDPVQCGPLPTIRGAKPSRSDVPESFPVGTRVTYVCLEGFLQIPERSDTIECLSSLEWSKLPELCGRSCPAPGGLPLANVSEEDERRSFYPVGTAILYVCRNGYERVPGQDSTRTCLEDLTWSKPPEFCTKKSCGVPEAPAHGRIPDTTRTLFGDTARIVCDEGYRLSGSHIACRLKGREVAWSQPPTCVAIPCLPPPEVANGTHSGEGEGYVFGSSVTYTCKSGFRLVGEASIHCTTEDNLNGVWSPAPQCKEVTCSAPAVPNGKKKFGSVAVYSYGDTIIFECNPGYTLRGGGDGVIRCMENNTWKPPVPICDPVQCGPLPTIRGAKPSRSDVPESFPVGTRVTYMCLEGFLQIPDRSDTIECLSSLEWSKLPELCGRSCPAPRGLPFAKVSEEDERRSFYLVGTTVSYVCRNGYERVPGQDSTRTCLEDLTWSEPPEFCTRPGAYSTEEVQHKSGLGANASEEEAQPESGHLVGITLGALFVVVCFSSIVASVARDQKKKGSYDTIETAMTEPRQGDSNYFMRKTSDTMNERYVDVPHSAY